MRVPRSGLLVGAAILFGAVIVAAGLATYRAVVEASATIARGQADLLQDEIRTTLGRGLPTQAEVDELVLANADDELTYLAIVDASGTILVEAGHRVGPAPVVRPSDGRGGVVALVRVGDRMRATYRRGRRARPPERAGAPPSPLAGTQLVFEFVPTRSDELITRAGRSGVIAVLGALLAVLLAVLYAAQHRRAERALRREEQSRRLAALGEMSAVLAHELRNPLASLKGHAQLLERALPAGEALRDKATRVVGEALRLERLSNELLAFVRTGELRRASVDVVALVRTIVDERVQERVRIVVEGPTAEASIDRERVRQIITNLIDNALQAGEGEVEVGVREVGADVEVSVRDRGPGIAEADLPRLFEPFFTTKTQGTGLGLAIAR